MVQEINDTEGGVNREGLAQEDDRPGSSKTQHAEQSESPKIPTISQEHVTTGIASKNDKVAVMEWQMVRQSKREKDQDQPSASKRGTPEKVIQEPCEGNISSSENSFTVLDNRNLLAIASQMGINQTDISFVNIDILRDLETARAALNVPTTSVLILMRWIWRKFLL